MAAEGATRPAEAPAAGALAADAPGAVTRDSDQASGAGLAGLLAGLLARDWLVLGALLVLAAAVRLPGLPNRGDFNGDQGHDMLTLLRFTRDGVFPLLGPPTSIGDFHHGAFYYLLLAPAAAISNDDPVAVVTWIALLGIAAVGVAWWLGRLMCGRLAGLLAGAILALSPAAISESTFIWNPNPIPLFAGLALATAWRARQTGHARWWLAALLCAGIVFQLHVLGIVFLPPILALLVVEWRAAHRRGDTGLADRTIWAFLGGLALIALLFVPLLIHELQFDWSETRNAIAYFTSGSSTPGELSLPGRLLFTLLRVVGWPLVGLVTNAPAGASIALALVVISAIWASIVAQGDQRVAIRWLAGTVAWSSIALAILAPSLQTVVAGLPNDHYHAFLDPVVVVLLVLSLIAIAGPNSSIAARAATTDPDQASAQRVLPVVRVAFGVALLAVVGIGVTQWPAPDPNGGWPAAQAAGARVVAITGTNPVWTFDVPTFKTADLIGFPIAYAGGTVVGTSAPALDPANGSPLNATYWVVACDRLFEPVVGKACGGPAEDATVDPIGADLLMPTPARTLVTRFDSSPRTAISVYGP
ncbi:MAG TPA: glycosyltransferase family 39 protein [Candidatus Limnocylindrales bacterium]|nr:glycosyltransferase family 39 protein [Candidatus Limnocylindrales bacterium]